MKIWHIVILGIIAGAILGLYIYFLPNYNYDGIADTPKEINLVFEHTKDIKGNEAIIAYHNLSDDKVYYHFTSRTKIAGLEYKIDYSDMALIPLVIGFVIFGAVFISSMGES